MKINLIPREEDQSILKPLLVRTLIISVSTVLLLLLFLGIRSIINKIKLDGLSKKEQVVIENENNLKDIKDSFEKYKAHPAVSILNNHKYYSKFFAKLQETESGNIQISGLTISDGNKVNVICKTSKSYLDISTFLKNLKKNGFTNIKLASISPAGSNISFTIDFSFPQGLILK